MSKLNKFLIIAIAIGFLGWGYSIIAKDVTQDINLDENIQPEDLGIGKPRLLPDHPLYFLKNWARGIRSFFAFNPIARAEIKLKFSNEKLMEVKRMIEENKNPEAIKKATDNYQREIERIKNEADKIREKARENPKVESFLDKFIHQQTLHQKLLQRLENQVPVESFEKIKEARERHLERFQEVMLKLEDRKEKITEKLNDILEKQKGSKYKHFKNLEVLLELEEKVPEEAKEAIRRAQENSLKRLQGDLEKMSPEDQEKFKEYLERISGEKERHLEILENLKLGIPALKKLQEKIEEGEIKVLERMEKKLEKLSCKVVFRPPTLEEIKDCREKNGRIIIEKDLKGCPIKEKCLIPGEGEILQPILQPIPQPIPPPWPPEEMKACITLWDPVCGKDGKTYSNECFVKLAGVEIDYQGVCKSEALEKPEIPRRIIPPPPPPLLP